MGLFGGSSKSSSNTTTTIDQKDNKVNNTVTDDGMNKNISGNEGSVLERDSTLFSVAAGDNSGINIYNDDFNANFGLEVIKTTIEAINQNLGRSLDYTSETVNRVLDDQSDQLAKISETPDVRLEGLTKLILMGAVGLGAYAIYKG